MSTTTKQTPGPTDLDTLRAEAEAAKIARAAEREFWKKMAERAPR